MSCAFGRTLAGQEGPGRLAKTMKTIQFSERFLLALWLLVVLAGGQGADAQIFVANWRAGTIGEFSTSGVPINSHFASGLVGPYGIAWDGNNNLFVADNHVIRQYTTSGITVNASLISGLPDSWGIACDGNGYLYVSVFENLSVGKYTTSGAVVDGALIAGVTPTALALDGHGLLYVANISGSVGVYTTAGAVVNASLITGLASPEGLALDGNGHLFVSSDNTIGEYNLDGTPVNAALISFPDHTRYFNGIALDGKGHLFAADGFYGVIREYNLDGTPVNETLITGLASPMSLVVVPEPSITALLALPTIVWLAGRRPKSSAK